ncbi:MAG TPA: hypothetical protein EYO59_10720 [Chromatiaceae bacterium]|nr:hypothetical protein [Chromatiaceae bacterium]
MKASEYGYQGIVKVLLQHGVDVAVKDNVSTLCVMSTPPIDDVTFASPPRINIRGTTHTRLVLVRALRYSHYEYV